MRILCWLVLAGVFAGLCLAGCSSDTARSCDSSADCRDGEFCNPDTGKCQKAESCAQLGCEAANRECLEEGEGFRCGGCLEGYEEDAGGDCRPLANCDPPPAPGSILQECRDAGRECVEEEGGARCGDCLEASQVLDEQTGVCRAPKTCDDIGCNPGEVCLELPGQDAYCTTECVGPEGQVGIVNEEGRCVLCEACDDASKGEAGPYLGGLSGEGKCICETLPGYYWQEGAPRGATPCDRDGDGWVRFSAKAAIEHTNDVVRGRARCTLRMIAGFVLHNEAGMVLTGDENPKLFLPEPRGLYESDRNDDQEKLEQDISEMKPAIPVFPTNRIPRAEELNSLTKACVSALADYNDNGVEDVTEWHGMTDLSTVHPVYQYFVDFNYFLELHRGWYQPGAETPGTCETPADCLAGEVCDVAAGRCREAGRYHILEKSRWQSAPDGGRVPVKANDVSAGQEGGYWRVCARKRDAGFESRPVDHQGMDFAYAWDNTATWTGMNHASQFKCLVLEDEPAPDAPPNVVDTGEVSNFYVVNDCRVAGTAGPETGWDPKNPSDPVVNCVQHTPAGEGVYWAAAKFAEYGWNSGGMDNYTRGCVDECAEIVSTCAACPMTREDCPGMQGGMPGSFCETMEKNFGQGHCGCGLNYGGTECRRLCEGQDPRFIRDNLSFADEYTNLFLEEEYNPAPRIGYWMCLKPSQTAYRDASVPWFDSDSYDMQGRIPNELRALDVVLCQDDDGNNECDPGGYRIR